MAHGRAGDKQRQRLKEGLPGPLGSLRDPAVPAVGTGREAVNHQEQCTCRRHGPSEDQASVVLPTPRPCQAHTRMSGAAKDGAGARGLSASGKACLTSMDKKLNMLNEKVDQLLHFQEDVTEKLQCVCRGMGDLEQGLHRLEASRGPGPAGADRPPAGDTQAGWPEVLELVTAVRQDAAQHGARLEALLRMVVAVDKAIALVGAVFQNSKVVDFIMQGSPWRKGGLADAEGPVEVGSRLPARCPSGWTGGPGAPVGRPARRRVSGEFGAVVSSRSSCVTC